MGGDMGGATTAGHYLACVSFMAGGMCCVSCYMCLVFTVRYGETTLRKMRDVMLHDMCYGMLHVMSDVMLGVMCELMWTDLEFGRLVEEILMGETPVLCTVLQCTVLHCIVL